MSTYELTATLPIVHPRPGEPPLVARHRFEAADDSEATPNPDRKAP